MDDLTKKPTHAEALALAEDDSVEGRAKLAELLRCHGWKVDQLRTGEVYSQLVCMLSPKQELEWYMNHGCGTKGQVGWLVIFMVSQGGYSTQEERFARALKRATRGANKDYGYAECFITNKAVATVSGVIIGEKTSITVNCEPHVCAAILALIQGPVCDGEDPAAAAKITYDALREAGLGVMSHPYKELSNPHKWRPDGPDEM